MRVLKRRRQFAPGWVMVCNIDDIGALLVGEARREGYQTPSMWIRAEAMECWEGCGVCRASACAMSLPKLVVFSLHLLQTLIPKTTT